MSKDGEHYGIRSEGPGGQKRFIEVKGRAQTGAIILTGPELDKLWQGERPRLCIIQNPKAKFNAELLYHQVQYVVQETDWSIHGEEVVRDG